MVGDPELCGTQYNIQKTQENNTDPQVGKKQLDYVVTDRRNRRSCLDAEANDMIHMASDHRTVTAHFRFPCAKKKKREEN